MSKLRRYICTDVSTTVVPKKSIPYSIQYIGSKRIMHEINLYERTLLNSYRFCLLADCKKYLDEIIFKVLHNVAFNLIY